MEKDREREEEERPFGIQSGGALEEKWVFYYVGWEEGRETMTEQLLSGKSILFLFSSFPPSLAVPY